MYEKKSRGWLRLVVVSAVMLTVVGGTIGYKYYSSSHKKTHYFPSYITKAQVTVPVYFPITLPAGYKVGDYKIIRKNIFSYSVANSKGEKFYVTTQPMVSAFNFESFKNKFVNPDEYSTPIGSVLVGVAGADLIGSIQTNQNTWVILNSKAVGSINDMETITRSLRLVEL
jgi:hypothetical protein